MGDLIERVTDFFRNEDIVDFLYTFFRERPELLIVVVAIVFIFVLSLWTMLERVQKRGVVALVPVYRFAVLFSSIGLNPWLSVLMVVPGVNIIMRVVFYVRIARTFNRSYLMVPFLNILPLVFLPIVAFGDGRCSHVRLQKARKIRKEKDEVEDEPVEEAVESFDSGWMTVSPNTKPSVVPKKTNSSYQVDTPKNYGGRPEIKNDRKGGFSIKVEGGDDDYRTSRGGFSIPIEGDDTPEEVHVLTMAELRKKRLQAKVMRGRRVVNDISAPRVKHVDVPKPKPKKLETPKIRADRMPSMRQGPRGVDIEKQRAKAEMTRGSEYERLLRQQQNAKMKKDGVSHGSAKRPMIDGVARRKPVHKKNNKFEIKISG